MPTGVIDEKALAALVATEITNRGGASRFVESFEKQFGFSPVLDNEHANSAPYELCEHADEWVEENRKAFLREHGYDPAQIWSQAKSSRFSFQKVESWIREGAGSGQPLKEATSQEQLGALIRFGVVKQTVDYYKLAKAVYRSLAEIYTSNNYEEVYDPLNRLEIPVEIGENEAPPETHYQGRGVAIRNRRFGRMVSVSKMLFKNDKSGQVRRRTQQIGDGMVYAEEILWTFATFNTYTGTANLLSNGGLVPSTNVAGQASFDGTNTTAGQINQQRLEDGYTSAGYVVDLNNDFFVVDYNAVHLPKSQEITALKLLQSFLNPTTPAGTAGAVQGIMAKNVMEGRLVIYANRFVSKLGNGLDGASPRWMLQEKGKGFVFQSRTAMEMQMEPPNVGKSLEENAYRYMVDRWMGAGPVEPRFGYWGN